uniref:Leucine Rich Repeat family protein n=1 Tax=Solanum tuberosum TaxID=4113 RepID=M1BF43_SOLTU
MGASVSVALPENWYVSDNFLGFAVCYLGKLIDITAHLIPLCDDGMSSMTQEFSLSNHSEYTDEDTSHFLLVPLGGLWDASKANGKTPNDYGCIRLYSPQERNDFGEINDFGVRLLYKDEAELHIGIRRSRYEEASRSSSKKQRSQVQVPLLPLFPTSPGL